MTLNLKDLSDHDAVTVALFEEELLLLNHLMEEGHTRTCANFQVFGTDGSNPSEPPECICSKDP